MRGCEKAGICAEKLPTVKSFNDSFWPSVRRVGNAGLGIGLEGAMYIHSELF
jgi:hypothetical protein